MSNLYFTPKSAVPPVTTSNVENSFFVHDPNSGMNIFLDPSHDNTPSSRHRNITNLVFVGFVSMLIIGIIFLIFASYFNIAPFSNPKTDVKILEDFDVETISFDKFLPSQEAIDTGSSSYGVPFIDISGADLDYDDISGNVRKQCSFIRIGFQIVVNPGSNEYPVTNVHFSRWKAFPYNMVNGTEFRIHHAVPYIPLYYNQYKSTNFRIDYFYEIAESTTSFYLDVSNNPVSDVSGNPLKSYCSQVLISEINNMVVVSDLVNPFHTESINYQNEVITTIPFTIGSGTISSVPTP